MDKFFFREVCLLFSFVYLDFIAHTLTYLLWLCNKYTLNSLHSTWLHPVPNHLCCMSYIFVAFCHCKQDAYVLDTQIPLMYIKLLLRSVWKKTRYATHILRGFISFFSFVVFCFVVRVAKYILLPFSRSTLPFVRCEVRNNLMQCTYQHWNSPKQ